MIPLSLACKHLGDFTIELGRRLFRTAFMPPSLPLLGTKARLLSDFCPGVLHETGALSRGTVFDDSSRRSSRLATRRERLRSSVELGRGPSCRRDCSGAPSAVSCAPHALRTPRARPRSTLRRRSGILQWRHRPPACCRIGETAPVSRQRPGRCRSFGESRTSD